LTRSADLRREEGHGEQALHVGADRGMGVDDDGGFQRRVGEAGRLGGLAPEVGVGEEAGSALRVVDDGDFEERVGIGAAEQLLGGRTRGTRCRR
jgi:hypothetical protein